MTRRTLTVILTIALLLLVIISTGLLSTRLLYKHSQKLTDYLMLLDTHTRQENWQEARKLLPELMSEWERTSRVWAMLMDHQEIDNVNSSIYKMMEYIVSGEKIMALAEISTLREVISHVPDKASFSIDNIF